MGFAVFIMNLFWQKAIESMEVALARLREEQAAFIQGGKANPSLSNES